MYNEILAMVSDGTDNTTNSEKLTDMIIGASSNGTSNTISETTTNSVTDSNSTEENNSSVEYTNNTSYSEDSSWSTSTKVLVGLGATAAIAAAGYGLYKFFISGDDNSTDIDVSVEE